MASVTLTEAWLHDANDLSVYVTLPVQPMAPVSRTGGEIRTYAGGRKRIVTRPSRTLELPMSFRRVPLVDVDTLEDWEGNLLLLRDLNGRTVWGTYFGLQVQDWRGEATADVSLTFVESTHSIEV